MYTQEQMLRAKPWCEYLCLDRNNPKNVHRIVEKFGSFAIETIKLGSKDNGIILEVNALGDMRKMSKFDPFRDAFAMALYEKKAQDELLEWVVSLPLPFPADKDIELVMQHAKVT